ncbi:hypothetical protein [Caudoviricetes sp.]|nr:hypothetical protein [Caudoviricetes sp.]
MLKKQERKDKLVEIYKLLYKIECDKNATQAMEIVLDMLAHDGVFIICKHKESGKAEQLTTNNMI